MIQVTDTAISCVKRIVPKMFRDDRGFFVEVWQKKAFANAGIDAEFVQDNHSRSDMGTLRGLHYQIQNPQGKLVRVTAGEVFDVAVDMRRSSNTFGEWVGEILSVENARMLWIPAGFAHGFYVISEYAEFQYKCTDYYAPEHERTIRWDDADLGIKWPLKSGQHPRVSDKDQNGIAFSEAETFP